MAMGGFAAPIIMPSIVWLHHCTVVAGWRVQLGELTWRLGHGSFAADHPAPQLCAAPEQEFGDPVARHAEVTV